jgi:hypothetical protein
MKKLLSILAGIAALTLATNTTVLAKDKEVTLDGEAKCAKCSLKEGTKCQTVIETEKNGKTTKYYVADNDVAKGFHKDVCTESKKVTATGTVTKVDGKQEIKLSKIEAK